MSLTFRAAGGLSASSGATSRTPSKPSVEATGRGLLIAVVVTKNNETHATVTAGWTLLAQQHSGTGFTSSVWIALQTAIAPTFTWTSSVACHAQVAYYNDAQDILDPVVTGYIVNSGLTNPHTSPGFNTDQDNVLAIYLDMSSNNSAVPSASGWSDDYEDGNSVNGNTRQVWGSKSVPVSGTATGVISLTASNVPWIQWQIQLAGYDRAAGHQVSLAEMGAYLGPPPGVNASAMEFGAWISNNDFRASLVEVGAWINGTPLASRRRVSLM